MEVLLHITWNGGRGNATIVLDKFLPCDQPRFRKFLKLVDEDFEHREKLRATIADHIAGRLADLGSVEDLDEKIRKLEPWVRRKADQRYQGQLKILKEKKREAAALLRNQRTLSKGSGGRKL